MSRKIVVVGAGLVGCQVARALAKTKHEVVVVSPQNYFEANVGSVRAVVVNDFAREMHVEDQKRWIGGAELVLGRVTAVKKDRSVEYLPGQGDEQKADALIDQVDALVLATGVSYPTFKPSFEEDTLDKRNAFFKAFRDKVEKAKSILIVGGGPVGVETAGEILAEFPGKKVTLVTNGDQLLIPVPLSASKKAAAFLESKGATVIFNQRVNGDLTPHLHEEPQEFKVGDQTVKADLVIKAFGSKPNTSEFAGLGEDALLANKFLAVDEYFGVRGQDGIFAVGDVAGFDEPKMVANGAEHVAPAVANVLSYLDGKGHKKKRYSPAKYPWSMMTTIGPKYAVLAMPICGGVSFGAGFLAGQKLAYLTSDHYVDK